MVNDFVTALHVRRVTTDVLDVRRGLVLLQEQYDIACPRALAEVESEPGEKAFTYT
jgi:hypothetical protein